MDKITTIKDTKELVQDIQKALEDCSTNVEYSVMFNWRVAVPKEVTPVQLASFLRHLYDAAAQFGDEFISILELRINQYDKAGFELLRKVQEIQTAKNTKPQIITPSEVVVNDIKGENQ